MKYIKHNFNNNIFNYEEILELIKNSPFHIGDIVLIKIRTDLGDYPFIHKKGIIIGYSYNSKEKTIEYSLETTDLQKEVFYNIKSCEIN